MKALASRPVSTCPGWLERCRHTEGGRVDSPCTADPSVTVLRAQSQSLRLLRAAVTSAAVLPLALAPARRRLVRPKCTLPIGASSQRMRVFVRAALSTHDRVAAGMVSSVPSAWQNGTSAATWYFAVALAAAYPQHGFTSQCKSSSHGDQRRSLLLLGRGRTKSVSRRLKVAGGQHSNHADGVPGALPAYCPPPVASIRIMLA